jgi:hypothetical protein
MGLGPPVCVPCNLIMSFHKERPHWRCSECDKTSEDSDGISHFFCRKPGSIRYPKVEKPKVEKLKRWRSIDEPSEMGELT